MPKPAPGDMMVNFAELGLPDRARRALARGVARPTALVRQVLGGSDLVQCPNCKGWRPAISVVKAKKGWMCDGCVSDERRRGSFEEW
jgi:hypothetical protein